MQQRISELLAKHGITEMAPISLSKCKVIKPYLLERAGIARGSVFLFAVPYYTTKCDDSARNISAYAVSRDYHRFFRALFDEILPVLQSEFPSHRFAGFTDHSPIAEAAAAVAAGLGFFGRNHLFLTEAHSSFVFLGEIITDAELNLPKQEPRSCDGCNACLRACPVGLDSTRCLSALTQKKGALSVEESDMLLQHGCAWGCDICQTVCPVTKRAKARGTLYSSIPFFAEDALTHLTTDLVCSMPDEEFTTRAYAWRPREVLLRNLALLEKGAAHD